MSESAIDPPSSFLAQYISWTRHFRVHGTLLPVITYRGHECESWELLPTLCRQKDIPVEILKEWEHDIVNEFRGRLGLSVEWSYFEVLAYARHHGAPTRLLDWSTNPLVGLWFAVANKHYDAHPGVVFQMRLTDGSDITALGGGVKDDLNFKCKHIHLISCPPRVDRTERQRSVFSLVGFDSDHLRTPLDQVGKPDKRIPIRRFLIPPQLKLELRLLLSEAGLDPYSIYGDPDSLGKAMAMKFDLSHLSIPKECPSLPPGAKHVSERPSWNQR